MRRNVIGVQSTHHHFPLVLVGMVVHLTLCFPPYLCSKSYSGEAALKLLNVRALPHET